MEYIVDKTLNCTGSFSPMPIIKTKRAIQQIQLGQILESVASDEEVLRDFDDWAQQSQQEVLVIDRQPGHLFRFLIRKTHE